MSDRKHTPLFRRLSAKGFQPAHVAEVGVHQPTTSNVYDYIVKGIQCTLVEPDPDCVRAIREHFAARPNVTLHPVAIYDAPGQVELVRRGPSTFVAGLTATPAIVNDRYRMDAADTVVVEARTFDQIDDGTIDLLSVDVEGSEWFVLKHMVSRPSVISVETHSALYRNPYLGEITRWMEANGYVLLYKATSDSVFVKRGVVAVGLRDRVAQASVEVYLRCKRAAKRVKHAVVPR